MRVLSVYETIIRDLKLLDDKMLLIMRSMISTYIENQKEDHENHSLIYDSTGSLLDTQEFVDSLDRVSERSENGKESYIPMNEFRSKIDAKFKELERTGNWPADPIPPKGVLEVFNSFAIPERKECYLLGRMRSGKVVPGATVHVPINSSVQFDFNVVKTDVVEVNGYPDVDLILTISPEDESDFVGEKELMMILGIEAEVLKITNPAS